MKKIFLVTVILAMLSTTAARAEEVSYTFEGYTHIGNITSYTGTFVYDNAVVGSTVYYPGTGPVQEGFSTVYAGAVKSLKIILNNGDQVVSAGGNIVVSNIQQAEIGAQLPEGLSLQAWTGTTTGSINGHDISNMYLAFLPVTPNYSWEGLDDKFGGNAEKILQSNPGILSPNIDTQLTGTSLPSNLLDTFNGGLFLGTNHGLTNTVNTVSSFNLAPVPEPETNAMFLAGLGLMGVFTRRRKQE